jgi:hypothetical protein
VVALARVHLISCREFDHFLRLLGTIGRLLQQCGFVVMIVDAEGPIPVSENASAIGLSRAEVIPLLISQ